MPAPDMTIGRASERLGITPVRMYLYLKLHFGKDSALVTEAETHILAEKLGIEVAGADAMAPQNWLDSSSDPNPRQRIVRYLLSRLQRQHRWWPNCVSDSALRHGVPEHDKGLVRDARDVLVRVGWLKVQAVRHKITEAGVGLNPENRDEIISFLSTGSSDDQALASWLSAGLDA